MSQNPIPKDQKYPESDPRNPKKNPQQPSRSPEGEPRDIPDFDNPDRDPYRKNTTNPKKGC